MATAVQSPLFEIRAETHLQRRVRYAQQYAMPLGSRCLCPDCASDVRGQPTDRTKREGTSASHG